MRNSAWTASIVGVAWLVAGCGPSETAPGPAPSLEVTTKALPPGTVGSAYDAALVASGGIQPYVWSQDGGQLPPGLALSLDGRVSGIPTTAGTFTLSASVADSSAVPLTARGELTISIAPGACVDADLDGASAGGGCQGATDCDDTRADVHPGAKDGTCDGVDDDCDGATDDDVPASPTTCGVGACAATGSLACVGAVMIDSCIAGIPGTDGAASDTDCDGIDDDCDGVTDEGYVATPTACGSGACVAEGMLACQGGLMKDTCVAAMGADMDATCDGVDDDCDGGADDDYVTTSTACGVGACTAVGVLACQSGLVKDTCVAGIGADTDDTCDGVDEDCDGAADEDYAVTPTSCGTGACVAAGAMVCESGVAADTCVAGVGADTDAACDGIDDDCDGEIDEDYVATPTLCGTGACVAAGAMACGSGVATDTCVAGMGESADATCDGVDDDCDGEIDDDWVPVATTCGEPGSCAGGGVLECEGGVPIDTCVGEAPAAADDTCDGIDDDCDGSPDEDVVEAPTTCGVGACAAVGSLACAAGSPYDTCTPLPGELSDALCDGADEDCDGTVDEDSLWDGVPPGAPCDGVGACGAGFVECSTFGAATCSTMPDGSAPGDAPEVCNKADDDCNGVIDDGCVGCLTDEHCAPTLHCAPDATCVACLVDAHCPSGGKCAPDRSCVACLTSVDCPAGHVCSGASCELVQLVVVSTTLPRAVAGRPYTVQLTATGGTGVVTWSPAGALPKGLVLDGTSGTLSGTPPSAGTAAFSVQATDTSAPPQTIAADLILSITDFPTEVSKSAPLAWWRFAEAAGDAVAEDATGHGFSGVYSATGVAFGEPHVGAGDSAVRFDGAGATRATVPTSTALSPAAVSIEALVRLDPFLGQARILERSMQYSSDTQPEYSLSVEGATRHVIVEVRTAPATPKVALELTSKATLPLNEPVHLMATYDGGALRLYIDGAPDSEKKGSGAPLAPTFAPIGLGNQAGRDRPFAGTLDEVAIYDRALPADEVKDHADALRPPAAPGPLVLVATALPPGTAGVKYAAQLAASGGSGARTWAVTSGGLPPGLGLDPVKGQVTGTPTTKGTFAFGVAVTDSSLPASQVASATWAIAVGCPSLTNCAVAACSTAADVGCQVCSPGFGRTATGGCAPCITTCPTGSYLSGTCVPEAIGNAKCVACATLPGCVQSVCTGPSNATCPACQPGYYLAPAGACAQCSDGIACTTDACEDGKPASHVPNAAACADGLFCNGVEACDPSSGCVMGAPVVLDDGVSCTIDACDEVTDAVTHVADDSLCDDGSWCNGPDMCDPKLGCHVGAPPVVDDGIACTQDACDDTIDTVIHTEVSASCDDGKWCNGAEHCVSGQGCVSGTPPALGDGLTCTIDACDEAGDRVVHTAKDLACADTLFCEDGTCVACAASDHCGGLPHCGLFCLAEPVPLVRHETLPAPFFTGRVGVAGDRMEYWSDDPEAQLLVSFIGDKNTGMLKAPNGAAATELRLSILKDGALLQQRGVPATPKLEVILDVGALSAGSYSFEAELLSGSVSIAKASRSFTKVDKVSPTIPFPVEGVSVVVDPAPPLPGGASSLSWPISTGVPLPKGVVASPDELALYETGPSGESRVAAQILPRARWYKQRGSLKWVGLDFVARWDTVAGKLTPRKYTLKRGVSHPPAPPGGVLVTGRTASGAACAPSEAGCPIVVLENGVARFKVRRDAFAGVEQAWLDVDGDGAFEPGELLVDGADALGPYWTDQSGTRYEARRDPAALVTLEETGPVRAVLRAEGWYTSAAGVKLGRFVTRLTLYAGEAQIRVSHRTITTWDHRTAATRVNDAGWRVPLASGGPIHFGVDGQDETTAFPSTGTVFVHQELADHVRAKRTTDPSPFKEGARGDGWLGVAMGAGSVSVLYRDFWQRFPKEMQAGTMDGTPGLSVHVWPDHGSTPYIKTINGKTVNTARNRDEIYKYRWAHQGELLEVRPPAEVRDAYTCYAGLGCPACEPSGVKFGAGCLPSLPTCTKCPACAGATCTALELQNQPAACTTCQDVLGSNYAQNPDRDFGGSEFELEWNGMANSEGRGMALGGEFTIALSGPGGLGANTARQRELFQVDPHALPDPRYAVATEVEGHLSARDPKMFPVFEDLLDRAYPDYQRVVVDGTGEYGMFSYGLVHSDFLPSRQVAHLHRTNQHSHYRNVYTGWLLYFRGAQPEMRQWARLNSDHFMNLGTVLWGDTAVGPSDPKTPKNNPSYTVGSYHCKTFTPWSGNGTWGAHYTDSSTYRLRWYLTGDGWARDLFELWGKGAGYSGPSHNDLVTLSTSRDTNTPFGELISWYDHSFDPQSLPYLEDYRGWMLLHDWSRSPEHATYNTRWIDRWLDRSRDPVIADRLLDLLATGFTRYSAAATAWRLTGELDYLRPLLSVAYDDARSRFDAPGDPLSGYSPFFSNPRRWTLQELPYYLQALRDAHAASPSFDVSGEPRDDDDAAQRVLDEYSNFMGAPATSGDVQPPPSTKEVGGVNVLALEASDQAIAFDFTIRNGYGRSGQYELMSSLNRYLGRNYGSIEDSPSYTHTVPADGATGLHRVLCRGSCELLERFSDLPEVQVLTKTSDAADSNLWVQYQSFGRKRLWIRPKSPAALTIRLRADYGKTGTLTDSGLGTYVRIESAAKEPATILFETSMLAAAADPDRRETVVTLPAGTDPWLLYAAGAWGPRIELVSDGSAAALGVPANPPQVYASRRRADLDAVLPVLQQKGCPIAPGAVSCGALKPPGPAGLPARCGFLNDGCGGIMRCAATGTFDCADPAGERCLDNRCVSAPPCTQAAAKPLFAIHGSSASDIWLGGDSGLVHWNGATCQAGAAPAGLFGSVRALHALSPTDAWAAGPSAITPSSFVLAHWDGQAWTSVGTAPGPVTGIWAAPNGEVLAAQGVGYEALLRREPGVPGLSAVTLGVNASTDTTGHLWASSVLGLPSGERWVGGGVRGGGEFSAALKGPLVRLVGGVETMPAPSRNRTRVKAISATGPGDVWFAGIMESSSEPSILHWDGAKVTTPSGLPSVDLNGIVAVSPTDVWAVGPQGIFALTGSSFVEQPIPVSPSFTLYGVWGASTGDVWAVGEQTLLDNKNSGQKRSLVLGWNGTAWTLR